MSNHWSILNLRNIPIEIWPKLYFSIKRGINTSWKRFQMKGVDRALVHSPNRLQASGNKLKCSWQNALVKLQRLFVMVKLPIIEMLTEEYFFLDSCVEKKNSVMKIPSKNIIYLFFNWDSDKPFQEKSILTYFYHWFILI